MKLSGVGASEGISVARVWHLKEERMAVAHLEGQNAASEAARFEAAKHKAIEELTVLFEKAGESDPETAAIFDIHRMMLEDPDFCEGTAAGIDAGHNAEWAVEETAKMLHDMFESMDDTYMRARAADVIDISGRVIRILSGASENTAMPSEPVIVAAEDLLPSQTVKLDKNHVVGYVTKKGSLTSHSAILARSMGIPCVVGMGDDFDAIPETGTMIVDGGAGAVIVSPTGEEIAAYERKKAEYAEYLNMLHKYKDKESVTKSGHKCLVCANIGSVEDAKKAKDSGAEGIGLFRSEFLYLDSPDFPDEETQFRVYKQVLETMAPCPVVIRTLDLGSDKQAPYFNIPDEDNPAMGYRAIRICLAQPEIFHTQLKALLRATSYGRLRIMFPMITGVRQVLEIKRHVAAVRAELEAEGAKIGEDLQLGVMIETPAAAIMSDELAKEVDFFSIGTNDLTQYTMAADRMNARVKNIFNSEDPAVLRMIEMTARNAHAAGIWVGVCGESGANTKLTPFFMECGIDELSVAASSVLKVRRAICDSN